MWQMMGGGRIGISNTTEYLWKFHTSLEKAFLLEDIIENSNQEVNDEDVGSQEEEHHEVMQ